MTSRTPVETLQAAISKLELLKAESTPGEWFARVGSSIHARRGVVTREVERYVGEKNADLIVTLHRTIDAQLAILRQAHAEVFQTFAGMVHIPDENALVLADAILGGDQ